MFFFQVVYYVLKHLPSFFRYHCTHKLTVVAAVPGQPFPFGAVGCSDDADVVTAVDGQIVLTSLGCDSYFCLIHGILLSCDLTNAVTG